jgi:hypothetical protein
MGKRGQSDYIFGCGALMPMELRRNQVRSDGRLERGLRGMHGTSFPSSDAYHCCNLGRLEVAIEFLVIFFDA